MRYQYTSKGYLNSLKKNSLTGVHQLMIINISLFICMLFSDTINRIFMDYFALSPFDVCSNFHIWQCLTYAFLHSTQTLWHIIFNMIGLWFLGPDLETMWGKKNFLKYYFVVAIGSGFITAIYMFNYMPDVYTIGASGAIYGLLVAYAVLFPNRIIYIYGILPLKVRTAAIIFGAISLYYSININNDSNISHIAHLAGMVMAFLYLFYWMKQRQKMRIIKTRKHQSTHVNQIRENNINKILDKMNDEGWESLTDEEKQYLQRESQNSHFDQNPN